MLKDRAKAAALRVSTSVVTGQAAPIFMNQIEPERPPIGVDTELAGAPTATNLDRAHAYHSAEALRRDTEFIRLRQRATRLELELKASWRAHELLVESNSWRITRPLR